MPLKDKLSQKSLTAYEKESLLQPNKVIVHIGTNHTLLFNNKKDKVYYENILKNSNEIIRDLLVNNSNYIETNIAVEDLQKIRESKSVEFIFKSSTDLEYIKGMLDVDKNLWNDIKQITSIIIAPSENKVYIVDQDKAVIHQFMALNMSKALISTIDQIKDKEDFAVFLNDFNAESKQLYGKYAIAPVSIASMPVLSVKREVETNRNLSRDIADFFDNDDSSKIYTTEDPDGTITFSDREEETVKLDTDGVLEYYKYNVSAEDIKYTDMKEAIGIAADYVSQHLGLDKTFYLSGIDSRPQGGRTTYIIKFDYKYDGVPIIAGTDSSKSAIEVEVVGQEVKRYKRNVRAVVSEVKTVKIKTFYEVLDIVQGGLDQRLSTTKSESIVKINDIYLAYIESDETLIPVWAVDVDVESSLKDGKTTTNKEFFINAEDGVIFVKE